MKKWYVKVEKQSNIIDIIFHEIILQKLDQEYHQLISYPKSRDGSNNFTVLVFNTSDLMTNIFQCLHFYIYRPHNAAGEWRGWSELTNCSLVCSHWLYHAWNPNSIYYINLSSFVNSNIRTSVWQRIINAQSITIQTIDEQEQLNAVLIKRFSMLKNITFIESSCIDKKHEQLIQILIQQCQHKIQYFDLTIIPERMNGRRGVENRNTNHQLQPRKQWELQLLNAESIIVTNLRFHIAR